MGKCIIQYDETDWQFLKRMASHFGAVLLPEAAADMPKFWFGMPEGRPAELSDTHYCVKKNLSEFMETSENYFAGLDEKAFMCHVVETDRYVNIGDRVTFKGKEWMVARSTAEMKNGILRYEYILVQEKGIRQNLIHNEALVGDWRFAGRKDHRCRQRYRPDPSGHRQGTEEKRGILVLVFHLLHRRRAQRHCMPQLGDAVKLYFPGSREEEALAISSVRKGGGSSPKMANPSVKYWGTPHGKEMMMAGKELVFTAKQSEEGNIFLKLHEEAGIEIHSMKPIVFAAEKDLEIQVEKKVSIQAQEGIYLLCGASSIVLDGTSDIQAQRLEMEGSYKAPVVVEDLPQEEELEAEPPQQEEESGFWGNLLDGVQLALDVVGLIPGVGEIADVANGIISLARGNYADAALLFAACIPFAGAAATGAKFAKRAMKAAKTAKIEKKMVKAADKAKDFARLAKKAIDPLKGKVLTAARTIRKVGKEIAAAIAKLKKRIKDAILAAKAAIRKIAKSVKDKIKRDIQDIRTG